MNYWGHPRAVVDRDEGYSRSTAEPASGHGSLATPSCPQPYRRTGSRAGGIACLGEEAVEEEGHKYDNDEREP